MSSYSAIHTYPNVIPSGMVVIYDETLAADTASFDVQNIPAGYDHLILIVTGRGSANDAPQVRVRFNNDSGSNYSYELLYANSTSGTAGVGGLGSETHIPIGFISGDNTASGSASFSEALIPDYAGVFHKGLTAPSHVRYGATPDRQVTLSGGHWHSTAAIDRITVYLGTGNFKTGSRLTIYGVGGAAASEIVGADGWTLDTATWTYASATTFTVVGDQTAKFSKGTRIKCTNSGTKYLVVTGSSYSAPNTTVTVTGGTDYTLANAAITSPYYSYQANPQGYPGWFNYTPTWTGFSADPTTSVARFRVIGNMCSLYYHPSGAGTSNATNFKMGLPVSCVNEIAYGAIRYENNGTTGTTPGMWELSYSHGTTIDFYMNWGGGAWTSSGNKRVYGLNFWYEI